MNSVAVSSSASNWTMHQWEHRLCSDPTIGMFGSDEVDTLPEPVQRYFKAAISLGTPLATSARFRMRGHIKVGRWLPFRARQILKPGVGFIWSARAAVVIAGYDRYIGGAGEMNWKLAGLVDVAHGDGPDISTSAAGRCGLEAILLPTALLPRFGVTWTADDDEHITGHRTFAGLTIPSAGRLGWHMGTDGWKAGEFFRFEITSLDTPFIHGGFD